MFPSPLLRSLLVAACFGASLPAAAAPAKASGCADCHGKDGISTHRDMPSIAGMSPLALEDQLAAYKAKARPCAKVEFVAGDHPKGAKDDMCAIADKLSDAEIAELAGHFAALPFVPFKNAVDATKAAAGKKYHDTNCEKCHTQGGSLADDDASILAGQPKGYLVQAMKELRAGEREQDKKMAPKIKALKDADAEALIEFYANGGK
jgi:sulfide dehydrogenase cytochrome subunit